jgi:hypothetical protein
MINDTNDSERLLRYDVRLLIKHPRIDPQLISERLGLAPKVTHLAGAKRATPTGTPLSGTYRQSMWGWSARTEGKRAFFDDVVALVQQLRAHQAFLSELVDAGGSIEVIVHLPGDKNLGSTIGWQELKIFAELKIKLGVEVFPDFN